MRIAILGFGKQGVSSYEYWNKPGNEITICDKQYIENPPNNAKLKIGDTYLSNLGTYDLIIRTPAIYPTDIFKANLDTPDLADRITTNTNEFFKSCPTKNIVGVTGTKGKGTTSTLIAKMLEACGYRVHLGGNIGTPPLELLKNNIKTDDWIVLELANFQLIDFKYAPKIGVCLMISNEHLDWHANFEDYLSTKQKLFTSQTSRNTAIYYAANRYSKALAKGVLSKTVPYMAEPGAIIKNNSISIDDKIICSLKDITLPGKHNLQNICAAVTAVWQIDKNIVAIGSAIKSVKSLPYRIEQRKTTNGILYFNDSFASAPSATIAAINAITENKVLIIGGYDRNLDLSELLNAVNKSKSIKQIILIGQSSDRLAKALADIKFENFVICESTNMNEIVNLATAYAVVGEAVVLSPGFPSFDMFKNFEERGEKFNLALDKSLGKYQKFVFEYYKFDKQNKRITLHYSYDGVLKFTETFDFTFNLVDNYSEAAFDRALQILFLVCGVSYFKAYLPKNIEIKNVKIDKELANFLSNTYKKGLGELFYINKLDPNYKISFPVNCGPLKCLKGELVNNKDSLVGLGGGKDSLLSLELLRNKTNVSTWMMNPKEFPKDLIKATDLDFYGVKRTLPKEILKLKDSSAYNGHVPVSAIFASLGLVVAIATNKKYVVVSNENSANDPTLIYKGVRINHQYSKSLEFEKSFQKLLTANFGNKVSYYSLLRPFSELRIAELFSKDYYQKYRNYFSSCNVAQTNNYNSNKKWCGKCPKCAFVYLILAPFVDNESLQQLFGKNLLLNKSLEPTYQQLLGIEGDKPLECIGEVQESRAAMDLVKKIYPELKKYSYTADLNYDFRRLHPHSIPNDAVNS